MNKYIELYKLLGKIQKEQSSCFVVTNGGGMEVSYNAGHIEDCKYNEEDITIYFDGVFGQFTKQDKYSSRYKISFSKEILKIENDDDLKVYFNKNEYLELILR